MARTRKSAGSGTVFKRNDRKAKPWVAEITTGYNDAGNPTKLTRYANSKQEAEEILAELKYEFKRGLLVPRDKLTVAECLDQYLTQKRNLKQKTLRTYKSEVALVKQHIGRLRVQELTAAHVRTTFNALAELGLSGRTQKKCEQHLTAALDEAVNLSILYANPARKVRVSLPRTEKVAAAWTEAEVQIFLKAAVSHPLYPLFYLLLSTGLRRGEALGIPWWAVDRSARTIRIEQAVAEAKGKLELTTLKTAHSRRTIHVPEEVLELLESQQSACEARGGLVFVTRNGTPIWPRNAYRSFQSLISSLPVRRIRLHDLRHTYATLALLRGIPIEVVSQNLGHARVSITLDVYRHVAPSERERASLSFRHLLEDEEA